LKKCQNEISLAVIGILLGQSRAKRWILENIGTILREIAKMTSALQLLAFFWVKVGCMDDGWRKFGRI